MFGRKSSVERQFARRTISYKNWLMDGLGSELLAGLSVEDEYFPAAKVAVEGYAKRALETQDFDFVTANALTPELRARAERWTPLVLESLTYENPNPDARFYNILSLADLLLDSFMDANPNLETKRDYADKLMIRNLIWKLSQWPPLHFSRAEFAQGCSVAMALAGGWLMSPERGALEN